MEKYLGKIKSINFGDRDGQLGIHLTLSFDGGGVQVSESFWNSSTVEVSEHTKWTEQARIEAYGNIMKGLAKYLTEAKVSYVHELKDTPVEVSIEGNSLKSWRILTEVI